MKILFVVDQTGHIGSKVGIPKHLILVIVCNIRDHWGAAIALWIRLHRSGFESPVDHLRFYQLYSNRVMWQRRK